MQRIFVTAHDITPRIPHPHAGSIPEDTRTTPFSKTVNFPRTATVEDVRKVYELAYQLDCKGVTIYRDGSRDKQVLHAGKAPSKWVNERCNKTTSAAPRNGPRLSRDGPTGCRPAAGPLYVTINEDEEGIFELFTTMGKAGGCAEAQSEAIGRMVSLAWRSGVQPEKVVKQLIGHLLPFSLGLR